MTATVQEQVSVEDELASLRGVVGGAPGPPCSVHRLVEQVGREVSSDAAEAVAAAADDPLIQPAVLSRYMEDKFGVKIAPFTINRHRRRGVNPNGCRCPE